MKLSDDKPTEMVKGLKQSPNKGNLFDNINPRNGDRTVGTSPTVDMTVLANVPHAAHNHDPVVGWVVIVKGAGKGVSLPLGSGMNSLGRAVGQRVKLDFGDKEISRENHAVVTYEPRGRLFYLQHGGGINLTYVGLGDAMLPVLSPTVLDNGQFIQIGSTTLKFVALCDTSFDWQTVI
jgi:hypothetical protein